MQEAPRLVLATRNPGKLRELEPLIRAAGFTALTLTEVGVAESAHEEALEAYATFAENALAKADYFFARCGGHPVLAEDSGLCVTALGGAPGVHSKRWGSESGLSGAALDRHNVDRLLSAVAGADDRTARYVCVAAVVWAGGQATGEGETSGRLLEERCGDSGFGYDPVFWSGELERCFGAVSREEKAPVSHRSRAVRAVLAGYQNSREADLFAAS